MNSKTKYIILTLAISAFGLLIFNNYKTYYWYSITPELEIAIGLFAIGIICFGLYFLLKKWRNILTKIIIGTFSLCMAQNLYLVAEYYREIQSQNRLSEYHELETCEEMENRFETDLKDRKLKYFSFGLAADEKYSKRMKTELGIENFNLGCTVYSEKICYNKLVENHIKKKYGKTINEILK